MNNGEQFFNTAAGGYSISRSLRFNSADSAYLSRTPASAGNRRTWTWAGWVKLSSLTGTNSSGGMTLFHCRNGSGDSGVSDFIINSNGTVVFTGADNTFFTTTQVLQDFSAWYHLVLSVDTTAATAGNRIRFYLNGSQVTTFNNSYNPTQNFELAINQAAEHRIGGRPTFTTFFNGYLADCFLIDSQALDPTAFGEFSATTGVWVPKAYSGSYGTNGFHLDFADNSAATAAALGKDTSGNGNNWLPNNFSVTAGAGNDSLVDVPTNGAQTDTGVGGEVRGNYATWNPLITSTNLTNGNLSVVQPSTTAASRYATIGMSSGKWYWEINVVKYSNTVFGIRTPGGGTLETPYDASGYGMGWRSSGGFFIGASNTGTGSMSLAAGDVLGLAFDAGAGTLAFYKNGTLNNTLTASSTYIGQTWFAGSQDSGGGNSDHDVNFGQRPFAYTAPSGFKALCTANLPAPLVTKPSDLFDVALYTGNNTARTITLPGDLSPDFVWIKSRSDGSWHILTDSVRGVNSQLYSNDTSSQGTQTDRITSFNSNGFSLGTNGSGGVNSNGTSYAAWCWDAGNTTVTNTQGSITSQVRANASAGFSIVTATKSSGSSTAQTFGHGLGVEPHMIILKRRNGSESWYVYNKVLGNAARLQLNETSAVTNGSGVWGSTTPTSQVFTVQSFNDGDFVAYCFAPVVGYSSFGSYTGNGQTGDSAPFIWTGFRPRWLMIKRSDAASVTIGWRIIDTARMPSNSGTVGPVLAADTSGAENAGYNVVDILSNGFKVRVDDGNLNANNGTYVYCAFAESPFAANNRAR